MRVGDVTEFMQISCIVGVRVAAPFDGVRFASGDFP